MEGLGALLDDWVREGLLTSDQADRIALREGLAARGPPERVAAGAPAAGLVVEARPSGRTVAAEIVGYAGLALAVAAAVVAVSQLWDDLATGAKVGIFAAAAVILGVVGRLLDAEEPPLGRLRSVLWAGSAGMAAGATSLVGGEALGLADANTLVLTGVGGGLVALVYYLAQRRTLQVVALAAMCALVVSGLVGQADHADGDAYGLAFYGLAAVWLVLGWAGILKPRNATFALGSLGALAGAGLIAGSRVGTGITLGIVTSLALLLASVAVRSAVLRGIGVVGLLIFVGWALAERSQPEASGGGLSSSVLAVVFGAGVVLLVGATLLGRSRRRPDTDGRPDGA